MITSNDRVAFEKWADEQGYELGRRAVPYTSSENRNGDYQSRTTQVSWLAWEACSEMRSVETKAEPVAWTVEASHDGSLCEPFLERKDACTYANTKAPQHPGVRWTVVPLYRSPEEPSAPRESDWHCVHCGRDNDPSETHCVQCEWSRKHTIAWVLHERGCFDHPCICGAVKISCSRCGGSQVDPDPTYQPCKQCCSKAPEVRASDPHDGITPCPPESRCVECWPEKASARPIPPGRMCNTHGNWNCSECCPPENGRADGV